MFVQKWRRPQFLFCTVLAGFGFGGAATIQEDIRRFNDCETVLTPGAWGNLNNNLYFLLLGLGVDDAFVLTSEFLTHSREAKEKVGAGSRSAERLDGWVSTVSSHVVT